MPLQPNRDVFITSAVTKRRRRRSRGPTGYPVTPAQIAEAAVAAAKREPPSRIYTCATPRPAKAPAIKLYREVVGASVASGVDVV